MNIKNVFLHLRLVLQHKWRVFINCSKCGLPWRGFMHDMSKFSPTEFFESAKYYQGNRSPITACRQDIGHSNAWLHHKGKNKHHTEYWFDWECKVQPLMPYKYLVECVCDKLAATRIYLKQGKDYPKDHPLNHFKRFCRADVMNPKTALFIETVFTDLQTLGEDGVLNKKYMKATYDRICLDKENP